MKEQLIAEEHKRAIYVLIVLWLIQQNGGEADRLVLTSEFSL